MANEHDKRYHSDRDIHRKGDQLTLVSEKGDKKHVIVIRDFNGILGARSANNSSEIGLFDLDNWSIA